MARDRPHLDRRVRPGQPTAGGEPTWYVRVRGRVTGPYSLKDLERLMRLGTLSRIHEASADRVTWQSLGRVMSAETASGTPGMYEAGAGLEPGSLEPPEVLVEVMAEPLHGSAVPTVPAAPPTALVGRPAGRETALSPCGFPWVVARLSRVEGLCAAGVLLVCLAVPHDWNGPKVGWWWQMWKGGDGALLFAFCIYATLLVRALVVSALRWSGLRRGWCQAALSGAGLCLLAGAAGGGATGSPTLAVGVPPAALVAVLIGLALFRRAAGGTGRGASFERAAAGAAAGLALIAGVLSELALARQRRPTGVLGWVVLSMVLAAVAWCATAGFAAATLAGAGRGRGRRAVLIAGLASLALLTLAAESVGWGVSTLISRFPLAQATRLVAAGLSLAALLALGVVEMLAAREWPEALGVEDSGPGGRKRELNQGRPRHPSLES